jgi:hypothetical protein
MRVFKSISLAAAVLFVAVTVWAGCPIHPNPGIYTTTNGSILPGRASEAWCDPLHLQPGYPGNTQNAESWNGAALATQWRVWGQTIDAAGAQETARSVDAYGNGWIDYVTNYVGGQFWLSKFHTWSDGANDLTGTLTYFNVGARVTLIGGQIVGVTSNVMLQGYFDDCPVCTLEYVITNAMLVWMPGWPGMPANYPAYLCGASMGELFDVCCIRASIYCPVGAETSTWGAIKSLYQ